MKKLLLFLLLLPIFGDAQKVYTLTRDSQSYLVINNVNNTYKPGDTLFLTGYFKSVAISNMSGTAANSIVFTNKPGETLIIGDSTWAGGSYAEGLVFRNCHYIKIWCADTSHFKIIGSKSNVPDAGGAPARTAYLDLKVDEFSDNFTIHKINVSWGGAGIWAKTEISSSNVNTWYPRTTLNNLTIDSCVVANTYNEGMYIGHTAIYWNINTNQPYYPNPSDPPADTTIYKQPIKWHNVTIFGNYVHNIGNDGIQTAAIDTLDVHHNLIVNWATKHNYTDNGGLLTGGRCRYFNLHDNIIHDGWGEFIQVYAEGGGYAILHNNLCYRNQGEGVSMRGTNNLIVTMTDNTIADVGNTCVRVNGFFGMTGNQILQRNVLLEPISPSYYIYTENGGTVTEGSSPNDNKKFATVAASGVDVNNFFLHPGAFGYKSKAGYISYNNNFFSGTFTRNNCGSGYIGGQVIYSVPSGKYSSTISQADADSKASKDVVTNGQSYANINGTCTAIVPPKIIIARLYVGGFQIIVYSDGSSENVK